MASRIRDFRAPDYVRDLAPYIPGKPIEETQREFGLKRVIKLASNENPLGPSPKAVAALRAEIKDLHRYPDSSAYRLKGTLAKILKVDPASLLIGNGSNEVIDILIRTFCVDGESILTSEAAFVAYKVCAQSLGIQTHEVPLTNDLRFDLDAMLRALKENSRIRMVFIPNPNNPTGTYVTEKELDGFLKSVSQLDRPVLVALDYAYWEYVTAKDLPDPMALFQKYENVVVLRTFSKVYGLAGLRVGYGVARTEWIASMEKVREPFNSNSLALAAAEAALGDKVFVRQAVSLNKQGMRFWEKTLRALEIPFWPSQGNFLLVDVEKAFGKSGRDVYDLCLRKGVIFRPVANYGLPHALRISVGTPRENEIAARALEEALWESNPEKKAARKSWRSPSKAR